MSAKYPILSSREIIKALHKIGFEEISQRGSHKKLKRAGEVSRTVIVPMHEEVARGTFRSILEQAGIDLEAFLDLL